MTMTTIAKTITTASDEIPPALLLEWSLPIVLTSMTMDSVLQTIAALLLEMKVLVVCDDIELLTATVLGVVSLLAPLVWTGPLIAVLPSSLSEYLEAPVPFVIGVQALPVGYVAPSDTLQLFPQSNRVVANALPLPDSDTFKADLLAMSLRRDSAYVDHIIERFRAYMQALLRKCNGQNPGPHAFYDCVKATQLFSSYQQRNEDIKQSRDGAIRHLKLEPRAPLIPRKSVSSNQHESTTLMVHNLFQVVCHGEVPASLHPPPEEPPTAAISALAKLRMMCAGTDKGALDDTPSPLELVSSRKSQTKIITKQVAPKRKTSAPLSPRPKPETITLVLRKDPSGVSVVKPMTQEMGVKPPPSHLSVSPSLLVPPTTHAPLLSTKSVRIIEPEQINLACNVSTPPTLSNPTLDDVDSSELPEQGVEHTTSATKIQRLYRQWSFKKHRVLYSRCNSTPTPPALSENTMISTHDLASVIQAKTLFVAGVLLGRHGTWGRRRLRSDSTIDHLMWEKVTGKHRVSGNSMVSFRDITLIEAGIKGSQRTTVMGSLLFASTDHDEMDLCWTVHTSDSRRRAVVFKASSTAERQRVMADLQSLVTYTLLSSGQVVLSSHTIGATEGELVVLRKFKDELRAGICIRKWRDPPTSGGRGWLKRASSLQHANIDDPKNVIAFASIQHVTPSESTSPHRSFIGSAQHYQRISIVSSVRTLVISTDPPQDLMRVYHGLNLLLASLLVSTVMSSATLVHRHVFGLKTTNANNVVYVDDQLVAYPAGHSIVVYGIDDKKQKFITCTENTEGITSISVCASRRFIAIAEKSERGVVSIYDLKTLKKRKVLTTSDCLSKTYVSMEFSTDNQLLLTQGGAPDWALVCWNWSKGKPVATIKLAPAGTTSSSTSSSNNNVVTQCSFSNVDPSIVCCTGLNMIKFFRIVDTAFRPMPSSRVDAQNFLCHAWLKQKEDEVVVGTATGDLLLFRVSLFVVNPDRNTPPADTLTFTKSLKIESMPSRVTGLTVSPNEETIVAAVSSSQLYMFPYQTKESFKTEEIEFLVTPFHRPGESGQLHVTGMDVCVRKPTIVTCGLDKSVRVWNYIDRTCEVHKQFTEEAHSVSMHPSGLQILVGFADKLRLMNVLMDDIRPYKEFTIKACRECQFSTGGHLFAAVNGNTIQVFSMNTCDLVANLRGHNGKVRSIYWNYDDSGLISAGMDGAVYQWDLDESKREGEFVQKGVPYYSAVCNREGTSVFAVGSDKMLKEIEFPASSLSKEFNGDVTLGQIVMANSQRMLFAGATEADKLGTVRSYKFPLTGEFTEFQCLNGPITRMRISFDDLYLLVCGEDGVVCIFEIRD
ncbi:hypothetical protein DYB38_007604, partial [Aphanomyces astaci]